jgi:UDP-glucuronate 4-epimerase
MSKKIIVTGAAGFIGAKVTADLIRNGFDVTGIDSMSGYYSPEYKAYRLRYFGIEKNVHIVDIADEKSIDKLFNQIKPDVVINLAAQGGVRASKYDPRPYVATNQLGFINLLESAERFGVEKFVYASSSSVYGDGLLPPFEESMRLPEPKSLYAASKISNELVAQYFPSNGTQRIGLRFFTVYGPLGRPDMAVFRLLASSILEKSFNLTADLDTSRDFTFVNDVSLNIREIVSHEKSDFPKILNVAGSKPYSLRDVLFILEEADIKIKLQTNARDPLDAKITHGSTINLQKAHLTVPGTPLIEGLDATWEWMKTCDIDELRNWYEYSA